MICVFFWDVADDNVAYCSEELSTFTTDFCDLVRQYGLPTRFIQRPPHCDAP